LQAEEQLLQHFSQTAFPTQQRAEQRNINVLLIYEWIIENIC